MVNKVGRSYKPPPNEINGGFPGRSAILHSDGTILQSMDDQERLLRPLKQSTQPDVHVYLYPHLSFLRRHAEASK
jgi:hypothetical protein